MITEIKPIRVSCDYCRDAVIDTDTRRLSKDTPGWGTKDDWKAPFRNRYLHICPNCRATKSPKFTIKEGVWGSP